MKKNKLPFKLKITLWYSGFMFILLSVTLYIIYSMSSSSLMNQTDQKLISNLNRAKQYITYQDGVFDFDSNILELDDLVTVLIYDEYGNILYGNPPRLFSIDTPFNSGLNSVSLPNNNRYLYRDLDYSLDGAPFKLMVRAISAYTNVNLTLRYFLIASLILGPIGILIAIYGGYKLMNSIFKPIKNITNTAIEIKNKKDLSLRIESEAETDELGRLVLTINDMLERIEHAFQRESRFTDDISHELRTPLTSLLLDIELLQHKREYDTTIIERLNQQIKWMRDLIENMSLSTQNIKVEKLEIINLKNFILNLISEYSQDIKIDIDNALQIKADRLLLKRVLTNLLNNAFQYGAKHVEISYLNQKLTILDDGIGISRKDLPKIWDRFYQVEYARSSANSSGLGLYFVKEAIAALNWEITVESELDCFTKFIIKIKDEF
ncbi:MAG: HAMP domain-containing sensor histidine kinase [Acholeplasmataceae bacterium]